MSPAPARRTAAQWFCLVGGLALVGAGIVGFFVNSSFAYGDDLQGDELILFEVNGWHNVVHILTGLLLLSGAFQAELARAVALVFAGGYGVVMLWGLIDGDDVLGIVPINLADNLLHIALFALATVAALVSVTGRSRPASHDIDPQRVPGARHTAPDGRVVVDGVTARARHAERSRPAGQRW